MQTGTIAWFNATSGEGIVRGDDGTRYYLHFSSIEGVSKNNYQWPTDEDQRRLQEIGGRSCEFTVLRCNYASQVETLRLIA